MFTRPIVFVVGAGASKEYGLPTGVELKNEIADDVRFRFEPLEHEPTSGSKELFRVLKSEFGDNRTRYVKAGQRLSGAMSLHPSMDEALHYSADDPEIVELGKIAIAHRVLDAERQSTLPSDDDPSALAKFNPSYSPTKNWLYHFLSMVISGTRHADSAGVFKKVTVINFNYDRTVEHFLFLALQRSAALTEEQTREAIASLTMLRPYGSLGPLPWQDRSAGLGYGGIQSPAGIIAASQNIRTFTEQFTDQTIITDLEHAFYNAELIVFLGFGFHQQNVKLLSPGKGPRSIRPRRVLATGYKMDNENYREVEGSLENNLRADDPARLFNMTATGLLERLRPTIEKYVA